MDTVLLDKTGTVTRGEPEVTDIRTVDGIESEEVLRLAASAESRSEHALASAIVAAARERGLSIVDPESFEAIEGRFEPSQCLLASSICDGDDCILGKIVVDANTMLRARLEETTLVEVGAVVGDLPPRSMPTDPGLDTKTDG